MRSISNTADDPGRAMAPRRTGGARNRALDGLRGCLAVLVLIGHVIGEHDPQAHFYPAQVAVWLFFAISGLVLTRSWDGRYVAFLTRRFVRLWPLFALCIGAGYVLADAAPSLPLFLWIPASNVPPAIDPPAWSLTIEAWAMLAMPLFAWIGRGSLIRLELAIAAYVAAGFCDGRALFAAFFMIGAWLSRYEVRCWVLEHPVAQWLGRISYPLYLSHWLVLHYCPGPMALRVGLAFALAQALTMTIERWSIAASRAVAARRAVLRNAGTLSQPLSALAGMEGLEPPTPGFGDRCSTN